MLSFSLLCLCFYFFLCSSCSSFCLCCCYSQHVSCILPLFLLYCFVLWALPFHIVLLVSSSTFFVHINTFYCVALHVVVTSSKLVVCTTHAIYLFIYLFDVMIFFCLSFVYIINMYGRPLFYLMPLLVSFVALCKTNLCAKFALH
jgi:hypothetical protein